jgi:site-specific DNA-methyltransferase (adenine-specific)
MSLRMTVEIRIGDCRELMKDIAPGSVDACVTDPPYHLTSIVKRFGAANAAPAKDRDGLYARASKGFMGKQWDGGDVAFRPETWRLVYDALKPGAHLIAFSGTRTYHRMACAIEDAGFEIRDQIGWLYGSGFPKSHDVSKGIDRAAGAERTELVGISARQWQGWGTALKPAWEPIVLARKPLSGTVAANVMQHGTGALNIDGCRVGTESTIRHNHGGTGNPEYWRTGNGDDYTAGSDQGRWPANVIHDGSDEVLAAFPDSDGQQGDVRGTEPSSPMGGNTFGRMDLRVPAKARGDSGSAARFFYTAKADSDDRLGSKHPTVKPVDLIAYLCRLVTPPGGTVLDPFAGSGTTGMAAMREGFNAILIEREVEYVADIKRRIAHVQGLDAPLFAEVAAQ